WGSPRRSSRCGTTTSCTCSRRSPTSRCGRRSRRPRRAAPSRRSPSRAEQARIPTPVTPQLQRVVVVGASLAGVRAAETLRAAGFDGDLVVVGDEPHPPYDRPPLSKEVLTAAEPPEIGLRAVVGLDVTWELGATAAGL